MRRRSALLLLVLLGLPCLPAEARRRRNDLVHIVLPSAQTPAPAHPFVNVVVGFGFADELAADPSTFRARIARVDITDIFRPIFQAGNVIGMRAELGPAVLKATGRRTNRLRTQVRSERTRGTHGKRLKDVDRVRFAVVEAENQPPTARIVSSADVILPGLPLRFDGLQSSDPEQDELHYQWDFGDGASSTDATPVHAFPPSEADVNVRLTVTDGQSASMDERTLLACLPLDPGRTAGIVKVESLERLEFGAVPLGTRATRTFNVRNADPSSTSQLRVKVGVHGEGFSLDQTELDLGGGETTTVALAFDPVSEGHRTAELSLVACASNAAAARMVGHAYGGTAPGTGPLPVASPLFYNEIGTNTFGILPSGARFLADSTVRLCQVPGPTPGTSGAGTGDYCLTDVDCAPNGGTCLQSSTCFGGERSGEPCTTPADCPGSFCPAFTPFEPADMCGDGHGGLYLMSDYGTFNDPDLTAETPLAGTLMRLEFGPTGERNVIQFLGRSTEETTQIACDGTPASAGGRLYVAEFHNVNLGDNCFRDEREALTSVRKSNGGTTTLMPRIDIVEGLPECEDFDPVNDLQTSRDGSSVFASMGYGLYRVRPTAQFVTPDVDDLFQLHPDGSVIAITTDDQGTTGLIQVYKILPSQWATGSLLLRNLTPCETIRVPNNRGASSFSGRTFIDSFAVDRTSPASFDGTILVTFLTSGGGTVLSPTLFVRGTIALSSPALSDRCSLIGFVNLETLSQLTF